MLYQINDVFFNCVLTLVYCLFPYRCPVYALLHHQHRLSSMKVRTKDIVSCYGLSCIIVQITPFVLFHTVRSILNVLLHLSYWSHILFLFYIIIFHATTFPSLNIYILSFLFKDMGASPAIAIMAVVRHVLYLDVILILASYLFVPSYCSISISTSFPRLVHRIRVRIKHLPDFSFWH